MTVRRDLQERIVARLRTGDRLALRPMRLASETLALRFAFADGEQAHRLSLRSLARRGEVRIEGEEVTLP